MNDGEKESRDRINKYIQGEIEERAHTCVSEKEEEKLYWMLPSITRSSSLPPFPHATGNAFFNMD
jgi:hypothetical protein